MGISLGGGSSSGSTQAVVTPEQTKQNQLTNQLLESYIPVLQNTLTGASNAYNNISPNVATQSGNVINQANQTQDIANLAAKNALGKANSFVDYASQLGQNSATSAGNVASRLASVGGDAAVFGSSSLQNLFSPDYEKQQVRASLQPAIEQTRDLVSQQNAQYGGAGNLGSSRSALASANLADLAKNRMQSTAAQTQAAIEAQRQSAATSLLNTGASSYAQAGNIYGGLQNTALGAAGLGNTFANTANTLGNTALNATTTGLTAAGAPLGAYNQFASTIFGVPQGTTTGNFTGTQGQNTSSKGFGGSSKLGG
jgi:hypothetical protein